MFGEAFRFSHKLPRLKQGIELIPVQSSGVLISELSPDLLFLCLSEYVVDFFLGVCQPWMLKDLLCGQPGTRGCVQYASNEILSILGYVIFHLILAVDDRLMQLGHVVPLEWHSTIEHGKQDDSRAPHINLGALIPLVQKNFWSDVSWGTTLIKDLLSRLDEFRHSKVCNLDSSFSIQKEIVKLDVSVNDVL